MKTNQVTEDWGFGPGDVSPTFRKEKGVQTECYHGTSDSIKDVYVIGPQ